MVAAVVDAHIAPTVAAVETVAAAVGHTLVDAEKPGPLLEYPAALSSGVAADTTQGSVLVDDAGQKDD